MAITLGVGPTENTNTGTSVALTLTGTTAGRGIVVAARWQGTATITSITISGESNATLIGTAVNNATIAVKHQLGYLSNITTGGNKTITMTLSASSSGFGLVALELAGGDTTSLYDSAENGATGNTAGPASCTVTTNTANACIVATATDNSGDLSPSGTGYVRITLANSFWYDEGEYNLDVGATGAQTVNMTLGGSGQWVIKAAAFKPSGGGGPSPNAARPRINLQAVKRAGFF